MLELKRSEEKKAEGFCSQVKNLLGGSIAVHAQNHKIAIQCNDLGKVNSNANICTALSEQFKLHELYEETLDQDTIPSTSSMRNCYIMGCIATA